MKILQVVNNVNITCGVSKVIFPFMEFIKNSGHDIAILVPKGTKDNRLSLKGIPFMEIDFSYENRNLFRTFINIIQVFNFLRNNKFEVVHCHHFYQAFLFSFFRKIFKYQLIQTTHQDFDDNVGTIPHYSADKIIFLSEIIRRKKIPHLKNKRTFVVPNPIIFNPSLKINVQTKEHEFTLAFIGRFSKEKNIDLIINALKIIDEERLKIIFIGEGIEGKKIKEFANKTSHKVEIMDERYNIEEIYLQADLILLPSLVEGVPNVIMEAGYFSKAVITSNAGGIPDIIEDGENGIIIRDLFKPYELKEKILLLKRDTIMREKLGEKLKEKISSLPSGEMDYKNILEIYTL